MRFLSLKVIWLPLALVTLISAGVVSAESEEGKAEGEGKKDAAGPLPKDQREFGEKTQRLNSLSTRIEEAEKQFQELVGRKAHEKNADEKQRIIKQMNEVTADRNKAADEYNKVKSDLNLRYPNQGTHLDRRYQTQSKKSVEELEGAAGLDELLTRTKKIIDKKFAPFADNEATKVNQKQKPTLSEEEKPARLRLEK